MDTKIKKIIYSINSILIFLKLIFQFTLCNLADAAATRKVQCHEGLPAPGSFGQSSAKTLYLPHSGDICGHQNIAFFHLFVWRGSEPSFLFLPFLFV
jgi:hypothetical protein